MLIARRQFAAGAPNELLTFAYDARGRRVSKKTSKWINGVWEFLRERRYLYDGWNLIAELNVEPPTSTTTWQLNNGVLNWTPPNSFCSPRLQYQAWLWANGSYTTTTTPELTWIADVYTWGLDLSGSLQGAGGVGGLLAVQDMFTQGITHFTVYDGNGNVTALMNAQTGAETARYEYGPFGELLRATGPMARVNPFRFSTKFQDEETSWLYYGYRYYDANTGRWLSRDPIEENGGFNLNGFIDNNPNAGVDLVGLALYAFDGTNNDGDRDKWNNPKADNGPTNVKILYDAYRGIRFYKHGVGTRDGKLANLPGLAGGLGGKERIKAMLKDVDEALAAGDYTVDVIGFSRGAAMAREFVNELNDNYPCLKVRWLGLFDTVGSFGMGGDNSDPGYRFGIPKNVQRVMHLTAKHEHRYFFPLASIQTGSGAGTGNPNYVEIELPGAHSDVGGGYRDRRGLANSALIKMHADGVAHGVPFDPLPPLYLDISRPYIHDSLWANDRKKYLYHPIFGEFQNPYYSPKRNIYYHP